MAYSPSSGAVHSSFGSTPVLPSFFASSFPLPFSIRIQASSGNPSATDCTSTSHFVFFFAATLHVSDYVSYRDVFHSGETLAPLTPGRTTSAG